MYIWSKILSIRVIFWNKMEKNRIENKNFDLEVVLDTLFRASKALELATTIHTRNDTILYK